MKISKINILQITYFIVLFLFFIENKMWVKTNMIAQVYNYSTILLFSILFLWSNNRKEKYQFIVFTILAIVSTLLISGLDGVIWLKTVNSLIQSVFNSISNKILLVILMIFSIIFVAINYVKNQYSTDNKQIEEPLYPERKKDLERLKNLIKANSIVGIDSVRGDGKTRLVNELLKEVGNAEIIKINLLNIGKNEIVEVIFNEVNIILKRNNNFFFNGKSFIKDQSILGFNLNPFIRLKTTTEKLAEFKDEIRSISKDVYIIIDDLDRTAEVEKIKNILNIILELSENVKNIKIIFLYSQEELEKIDSTLDRDYIEKYIPFFYKLSGFDFKRLLKEKLQENINLTEKNKEAYDFLFKLHDDYEKKVSIKAKEYYEHLAGIQMKINTHTTIRKIENFVKESEYYLKDNLGLDKKTVIAYLFLKHFNYSEYKKIENNSEIEEAFPIIFEYKENRITMDEISKLYYALVPASKITVNGDMLIIFVDNRIRIGRINELSNLFLGEELFKKVNGEYIREKEHKLYEEFLKKIKEIGKFKEKENNLFARILFDYYHYEWQNIRENVVQNKNIIHTIKKLNSWSKNDMSEVNKLIRILKNIFKEETIEKIDRKYKRYMLKGALQELNYMGGNQWQEILSYLDGDSNEVYCKNAIKLMLYKEQGITNRVLVALNKLDNRISKKLYLSILEEIAKYKITEKLYIGFLKALLGKLLKNIGYIGFVENYHRDDFDLYLETINSENSIEIFRNFRDNLLFELNESYYSNKNLPKYIMDDLDIIKVFLENILQFFGDVTDINVQENGLKMSWKTSNDSDILLENDEELEKNYNSGKIRATQILKKKGGTYKRRYFLGEKYGE